MKNKLLTFALALSFAASVTACGSTPAKSDEQPQAASNNNVKEDENEDAASDDESDLDELDALGDIEVDKGLFNVELTIPADYIGDQTQDELDQIADEYGYQSITLNSDGSATYKMTKSQHKALIEEYRTTINEGIDEMIGSEDYPNITKIESNEDFTEFTVTTKSTELDMNETLSPMIFYAYGGMYSIFTGETVDNISITYINEDTGEVISTSNSKDL